MVDYSNPILMQFRTIGQRLGILRPLLLAFKSLFKKDYEQTFHQELLRNVKPGFVVWDVGANIGYYTNEFSKLVGPSGKVIAFEPSPKTFDQLKKSVSALSNVAIEPVALSNFNGSAKIFTSDHSTTDSLSSDVHDKDGAYDISVLRGDAYSGHGVPNIIKVDVEGFEKEVIEGFDGILKDPRLEGLFVEIHFQSLAHRGLADAPKEIVDRLKQAGFKVSWTDPSHIAAVRPLAGGVH